MKAKPDRKVALARLLKANGLRLVQSDAGVQSLDNWFVDSVEPDPQRDAGMLMPIWYSVVNDIALYLGDIIIERAPALRWEFFTSRRRDPAFQRHVITGFPAPNSKDHMDVDWMIATYAHRTVVGMSVRDDEFVQIVKNAGALA
jgi:hypothetical protein